MSTRENIRLIARAPSVETGKVETTPIPLTDLARGL